MDINDELDNILNNRVEKDKAESISEKDFIRILCKEVNVDTAGEAVRAMMRARFAAILALTVLEAAMVASGHLSKREISDVKNLCITNALDTFEKTFKVKLDRKI